ncbi:LOW QUALITY PROTEIN: centromere protein F-like [Glossophaga mutica]
MSWAVGDGKEGLPTRAPQKTHELEGQLHKLKKERPQRQFQLETLEAVLQKQTHKVENEESEATTLQRENRSLRETCENLEKAKQKISHELQVKESQVNIQEGQLSSARKQIEKLEQELKSCKSELERSQKAARPADVSGSACNTPQKLFTTPITPRQFYSGSKYEDGKEKYNKEVEELKRLEAEVKGLQAKKASQVIPQNTMKHLNISRHQASRSLFPWQHEHIPSPLSSDALQTPIRRGYSASHFPQKLEVTPSSTSTLQVGQRGAESSFIVNSSSSQLLDQQNAQSQEPRSQAGELELRWPGQEKETQVQVNQRPELQLQQDKAKMELSEKEKVLDKSRAELTAQYDQASSKYTALEQKLKKLTEDLSFYRQNAESSRCSLEQKLKLKGKQFQEELSCQQRAFQILYRESSQVKGRLTRELQEAKNARNILQAELDKVTSGKHQVERELEELKQHLGQTQQALQASQTKENELRRSSEEMKKENSFLKSQSEQSAREVCHLQEELKKTKQCLSQIQNLAEEMRAKNASQETMLRDLQEKINQQENSLTSEKLKLALADLEKQRDGSRALFQEREHHIEQVSEKFSKTERESEALLGVLEIFFFLKEQSDEWKEEKTLFSHWKIENELIKQIEENEILLSKINLEMCLQTQQIRSNEYKERVSTQEMEGRSLSVEMRKLCNVFHGKTVEVETQKEAQIEFQQKADLSDQKHKRETESTCLKVSELTKQVEDVKHKLQLMSSDNKDQRYQTCPLNKRALQGRSDSCDKNRSEESAFESNDRTSKQDLRLTCDRNVQQDLSPEMEKVTKAAAVMLVEEGCQEQSLKEKAHLQEQLQSLIKDLQALSLGRNQQEHQIEQVNHKKESLLRESESLQNKLLELEKEALTVTKSLETAGMQKGEVAMRLSSPQDKDHLMRNDTETLRVSMEADEKKHLEEMKGTDSKKENLASHLQMTRKKHEATILHAEYSKAEVETLKSQIESMMEQLKASELDLMMIRSEKENLIQQLQEKQGQMTELDTLRSSLVHLLEAKEEESRNMQEESKAAGETLEKELKELMKEVAALCDDSQARKFPEQSSPVQRVQQLSKSIKKLKDQLEDDDKKQFFVLAKLQETKHQAELLKGEVDQLEKELKKAKKTHERATREAQSSKAEVEKSKAKIEEMASSLKDLRSEKEKLTKELQKAQERICELERLKASFDNLSQAKEQEMVRVKQECKLVQERLEAQMKALKDKRPSLGDDHGTWKAREQGLSAQIAYLQLEKCQLLQGLDQARSHCLTLQSSVNGLIQEVQDGKDKVKKREQEINLLKQQIQNQAQQVSKLSQRGGEPHVTRKQTAQVESLTVELEQKVRRLQSKNDALQDTYKVLQNSYRDLQKELESTKMEKLSYVERVNSLTSRETELQRKVHEITQKMTGMKEEFNGEKNRLTEELNLMSEEMKHNEGQLKEFMLENSDLKKSLDCIHSHQMEKQEKMREEIAEYQRQLEEAEKRHQTLLLDANKQHEMEIQTYREKLTSTEECLSSQKVEIDLLKSSKEQLSNSLKENTELLGELIKTKMNNQTQIKQLKKEKEHAQGNIDFCLRQYKLMEEEMKRLQKELCQLEEAAQEKQKSGALVGADVDELMTEVKHLKATLEGKSKEAEEYLDKYCSLLTSHEKLEREKEMLEAQVAHLTSQQSPPNIQISPLLKSVDPESPPVPCVTEKKGSSGQTKASGKRQRSGGIREKAGGTAPSTPHPIPKRSRKAAKRSMPPAEDAEVTELEPQGLPEVGKEGSAAIPTGKIGPYNLRSTTMACKTSPRVAAHKLTRSLLNICKESHAGTSQPRAAGSRSQKVPPLNKSLQLEIQEMTGFSGPVFDTAPSNLGALGSLSFLSMSDKKVKVAQQSPSDSGTSLQDPSARPLLASKLRKRQWAGSLSESLKSKRGCPAPSSEAGTESRESCSIQ